MRTVHPKVGVFLSNVWNSKFLLLYYSTRKEATAMVFIWCDKRYPGVCFEYKTASERYWDYVNFLFYLSVPASYFKEKVTFHQLFSLPGPCDPYEDVWNDYFWPRWLHCSQYFELGPAQSHFVKHSLRNVKSCLFMFCSFSDFL